MKYSIKVPDPSPTRYVVEFTNDEVVIALREYAIKNGIDFPESKNTWVMGSELVVKLVAEL